MWRSTVVFVGGCKTIVASLSPDAARVPVVKDHSTATNTREPSGGVSRVFFSVLF